MGAWTSNPFSSISAQVTHNSECSFLFESFHARIKRLRKVATRAENMFVMDWSLISVCRTPEHEKLRGKDLGDMSLGRMVAWW